MEQRINSRIFCQLAFLCLGLYLSSCSAQRNNPISKAYHNTTAKYNAYWIARERILEVEASLDAGYERNFNEVLPVYTPFDSTDIKPLMDQLEDCIKKASIAIQFHSNSQWVYPSYILVGKARYYMGEYGDAIETFKFVNTKSKNPAVQHEALIFLIRTFVDAGEMNNAIAVSDYLKKEKLNRQNQLDLFTARAYLYQKRGDDNQLVFNLVSAVDLLKNHKKEAKGHFTIGQIYEKLGFESEAYRNYRECIKNNPDYELYFFARLNMARVTNLSNRANLKKIRKYFDKLAKDRKNEGFQDRIYFELGEFEARQNNIEYAVDAYKMAVRVSSKNKRQKALAYLRLGEIYYEGGSQYELAKLYYDSTIATMPKDYEGYEALKQRQEILSDFVKQIKTVQVQDSLLSLSSLDSTAIEKLIDLYVKAKEKEQKKAKKRVEAQQARLSAATTTGESGFQISGSGEGTWYFYNPNVVTLGYNEFLRVWGNRPLEDNWQRINSAAVLSNTDDEPNKVTVETTERPADPEDNAPDEIDRRALWAAIPFSVEAKKKANIAIEHALFRLGNLYYFDLKETDAAAASFEDLLVRYDTSQYVPEVMYQLYLIYQQLDSSRGEYYKNRLIEEHPKSIYARTIVNPNYREESNAISVQLQGKYKKAYALYQQDSLGAANVILSEALRQYPDNSFSDNLRLLQILIIGRTEGYYKYKYALSNFANEYPESDVQGHVDHLLASGEKFQLDQTSKGVRYIPFFRQKHFYVLIYPNSEKADASKLVKEMENFITIQFPDQTYNSGNLILDDKHSIVMVSEFASQDEAMVFYRAVQKGLEDGLLKFDQKFGNFVITGDNFELFYKSKDLKNYQPFFKEHYLNETKQ